MARFDIKKLIDTHTKDGEVDYTKINDELEQQNRNIVVKEASKELDRLKGENLTEIIKGLGIEGNTIDDVKLYVKKMGGSTDEIKEELLKLEKSYKELESNYQTEVDTRTKYETEQKESKQLAMIKGLGVTDEEQVNYLKWKFTNQVTEDKDFASIVEDYKKENSIDTTTKFVKDTFGLGDSKEMDISSAWKAKRQFTRK